MKSNIDITFSTQQEQQKKIAIQAIMADIPSPSLIRFVSDLERTYSASHIENEHKSTKKLSITYRLNIPIIEQSEVLKTSLIDKFQLTNEDIAQTDQVYKNYLISSVKHILETYSLPTYDPCAQDKELEKKCRQLEASQPTYDNFSDDTVDAHASYCFNLISNYFNTINAFEMYLIIAANIKTLQQFDRVLEQLKINELKTVIGVGDAGEIKKFKRNANLAYHPDKKSYQLEKAIYTPLFQDIKNIQPLDMETFEARLTHTYTASTTINDTTYTRSLDVSHSIHLPSIKQTTTLKNMLQETYNLTDEALQEIEDTFQEHLVTFIEKIQKIKKPVPWERVFLSYKQFEADLLFLTNYLHNHELIPLIDQLRSSQPKYGNFETGSRTHHGLVMQFQSNYVQNHEFQENLYRIYFQIASEKNEPKVHWLYKKETYANLTGNLLKIPLMAILIAIYFMALVMIALAMLTPLILFSLFSSQLITQATAVIGLVAWGTVLFLAYHLEIEMVLDTALDAVNHLAGYVATKIDRFIQTTFHTNSHATEFGRLLDKAQSKHLGGSRFRLFGEASPPRNRDDLEMDERMGMQYGGSASPG
jgi:hypothetical protein